MEDKRDRMVRTIREKYDFNDETILTVLRQVPREKFTPLEYQPFAYDDRPLPIGKGQTMSQPFTVALMTSLLKLKGSEKVLEVGTGSGYQAAVLAKIAKQVYTVEIIPELAEKASKTLKALDFANVHVKNSSGEWGWKEHAPFNAIIVTAGLKNKPPDVLFEQLHIGGVMIAPVGKGDRKEMVRYKKKSESKVSEEYFGSFQFVPFVKDTNGSDTITS